MGTNSHGSRQAKQAVEPAERDSVSASISVLFRNRAPEQQGDDLDEGWGDDEESSSPSAVGEQLPAGALAPARVPSYAASEWPGAPLSRAPSVPDDESDWDLPLSASTESTALASCVRELAPTSTRDSNSRRLASSAAQIPPAAAAVAEALDRPASEVSAPAIDITIEPSFHGTEPRLNVDNGSSPDLTEVLSGPRSNRSVSADVQRTASGGARGWLVGAAVLITVLVAATYVGSHGTSMAPFRAQDPATTANVPLLPHLAVPNPPVLDLPSPAVKPALEEIKAVTADPLLEKRATPRRRVRAIASRPRPIDAVAQPMETAGMVAEPTTPSSAAAPVGVVDLMIAAPAPKAVEPLQPPPAPRTGANDETQPSRPSK